MSGDVGLEASFRSRRGGFELDLELSVAPGRIAVLVGPNGAGKSTALRTLAGLVAVDDGRVSLNGRVLDDRSAGVRIPTAARGIGVVFQDYLLFPHLTAVQNVAFGPLAHGTNRTEATARAASWLDRLGVGELAERHPRDLSGGQAQRVALARALVLEPSLLLLDEPLAALDAATRLDVRTELAQQLRAFRGATVIVTHDPVDALALGDELVVLERGSVSQRGRPADVARAPSNGYVATLMGLNFLREGRPEPLVFPPGAVRIDAERPADAELVLECRVRGVEEVAGRVRMLLSTVQTTERLAAELDARALDQASVELLRRADTSATVWVSIEPEGILKAS